MGTRNVTRLAQLSAADLLKMVPDPDQGRDSLLTSRDLLLSLQCHPGSMHGQPKPPDLSSAFISVVWPPPSLPLCN